MHIRTWPRPYVCRGRKHLSQGVGWKTLQQAQAGQISRQLPPAFLLSSHGGQTREGAGHVLLAEVQHQHPTFGSQRGAADRGQKRAP